MIIRKYIYDNLSRVERLYSNSQDQKETLLFAKLYIIELCGWIEDTFDDLFYRCLKKNTKEINNEKYLKELIKGNYGFSYEQHFRKILMIIIGCLNFERIEKRIKLDKKEKFRLALNRLEEKRNIEAHSYLKQIRNIDAPSVANELFEDICTGLREYYRQLKKLRIL